MLFLACIDCDLPFATLEGARDHEFEIALTLTNEDIEAGADQHDSFYIVDKEALI